MAEPNGISECCGASMTGIRCTNCGHRQTIKGVAPVSSRRKTLKNPVYPVIELRGRAKAKKMGKKNG